MTELSTNSGLVEKHNVKYVLMYVKQILFLAVTGEIFKFLSLFVTISAQFTILHASAVANYELEKPLGSLDLGGITINVMIGNILEMRIVFRNNYLDIFIVGNIQVSYEMSR